MNAQAVSISSGRIDIWLRDTREFGALQPDGFRLDLSLGEGLGRFDLRPHCAFIPIYFSDAETTIRWRGQGMDGTVTLVGEDSVVLDQVEFRLDSRTAGLVWSVLALQEEMGWSRKEVEERTWWAVQGRSIQQTIGSSVWVARRSRNSICIRGDGSNEFV